MEKENSLQNFAFLIELAERTNQVVFAYNIEDQKFSYLNPSFEKVWNKTLESAYASPSSLLGTIHPKDKEYLLETYHEFLKEFHEGTKKDIEFRINHPDKGVRWLCLTPVLIKDKEKRLIAGFVIDQTSGKENEANVQRFAGKKNSLLEILSHDLSGPLINIQGLSSLLAKEFEEYKNPKIDKMIQMIAQTSKRSIGMIREFVKQEFLESVNVELVKKRVNVVDVVGQTIEQYQASERKLAKTFDFSVSDKEILAEIDEYKFNQVLNNLISNSIKFTHDGGVITIRIEEKNKAVLFLL